MRSDGIGRTDQQLWLLLRLTLAALLAAHGWMRFLGGGVVPFGDWLNTQGLSAGFYLAAAITAYEILATLLYAAGKWVWQLSGVFVLIYSCGLVLNHAISMQLRKAEQPISLFELWSLFNAVVQSGQTAQAAVFLDVLKPHVTKEFWLQLNEFSSQENFDAYAFMQQL